jgi:hypothetical protein
MKCERDEESLSFVAAVALAFQASSCSFLKSWTVLMLTVDRPNKNQNYKV